MTRKIISLTEKQDSYFKTYCQQEEIPFTEIIRRILDNFIDSREKTAYIPPYITDQSGEYVIVPKSVLEQSV